MRISWVDNLRGIGILLIVLGHCSLPAGNIVTSYLFSFHVALFFILSGFLFDEEKYKNFNKFVKNKFFRLIVPFFFFNVIYIVILKLLGHYQSTGVVDFLVGLLYGDYLGDNGGYMNNTGGFNLSNTSTWFLPALFITSIYYFLSNKIFKNRLIKILFLIFCSVLVFIESKYSIFRFPWGLEISFMMMLFYGMANTFKKEISSLIEAINFKYLLFIPFILVFHLSIINITDISVNRYGNYLLLILNSFLGVFTISIIAKNIGKNKILNFFGRNSIIVLGFEWIKDLLLGSRSLISLSFIPEGTYVFGFFQFFLTIILLVPIIFIVNKYFYFILGIRRS